MQPTQFLNDTEHISAYIKALEFYMIMAGSMLENFGDGLGPEGHMMDRIGPLLSPLPAG